MFIIHSHRLERENKNKFTFHKYDEKRDFISIIVIVLSMGELSNETKTAVLACSAFKYIVHEEHFYFLH